MGKRCYRLKVRFIIRQASFRDSPFAIVKFEAGDVAISAQSKDTSPLVSTEGTCDVVRLFKEANSEEQCRNNIVFLQSFIAIVKILS